MSRFEIHLLDPVAMRTGKTRNRAVEELGCLDLGFHDADLKVEEELPLSWVTNSIQIGSFCQFRHVAEVVRKPGCNVLITQGNWASSRDGHDSIELIDLYGVMLATSLTKTFIDYVLTTQKIRRRCSAYATSLKMRDSGS